MRCAQGHDAPPGATFCPTCGDRLAPAGPVAPAAPAPVVPPPAPAFQARPGGPGPSTGLVLGIGGVVLVVVLVLVAVLSAGSEDEGEAAVLDLSVDEARSQCEDALAEENPGEGPVRDFYEPEDQDYVDYWRPIFERRGEDYPVVQYTVVWDGGEANCVFGSDGSIEFNQTSVVMDLG